MGGLGKNAINGLINGMKSKINSLTGVSKTLGTSIINAVKKQLKIKSPSRIFFQLGNYTTEGFIQGIANMQNALNTQMAKTFSLSPSVTNTASTHFSPNVNVVNNINVKQDSLGQVVKTVKTFSGGAKNDYNYGMGV